MLGVPYGRFLMVFNVADWKEIETIKPIQHIQMEITAA
jgi:hypothetical protein